MKIRQLTPEEIKRIRLSTWALAIFVSWLAIVGPGYLAWNYIVVELFPAPRLSMGWITAYMAFFSAIYVFVKGPKK